MSTKAFELTWAEENRLWLTKAIQELGSALERRHQPVADGEGPQNDARLADLPPEDATAMSGPPALDVVSDIFGLSGFERNLLLLCAGVELDGTLAEQCGAAQGREGPAPPNFSLALAVLPGAHWSAVAPTAPLRRWQLIHLGNADSLTVSPLRIDERVLHYIAGIPYIDVRLDGLLETVDPPEHEPAASHREIARHITTSWSTASGDGDLKTVRLSGKDLEAKLGIASGACAAISLNLYRLDAAFVPATPQESDSLARLWTREAALSGSALFLDCHDVDSLDTARSSAVRRFIDAVGGALIVAETADLGLRRRSIRFDVPRLDHDEQHWLWRHVLEPRVNDINGVCQTLSSQFDFGIAEIITAAQDALSRTADLGNGSGARMADDLWAACRARARPPAVNLAQLIEPRATWDDLVLPAAKIDMLRQVAAQVRQRSRVYNQWGFARKSSRGLGITALFSGPSGTGKTMAAEVLAQELRLDLYRIDLSSVVSKYIGETEKNLSKVFDAAESGGVILLFDEADALFGKRSEVKDSHDRYANLEISYLLQRMEDYQGLAILTTNMKTSLDTAFQRRLRFVVQFPFPDAKQRAEIWRRSFPEETPTGKLYPDKLAQLNVSGGNIRNIAMAAAFCAADQQEPVQMKHLLTAARTEYAKLEKPLTEAETRTWVR